MIYRGTVRNGVVVLPPDVHLPDGQDVTVQAVVKVSTRGEQDLWTNAKNARRCDLIDKEIEGTITEAEQVELEELQRQAIAHRDRVAPLPIEAARELHRKLLAKKRQRESRD